MDYIIAIPSYNRKDVLQTKTLALLRRHNIPRERIHIFVVEEEKELYETIPQELYGQIIVGLPGYKDQRNFSTNYYPHGTHLVAMDDDVEEIYKLQEGVLLPAGNLEFIITKGFEECVKRNYHLWGVYPVLNKYFMEKAKEINTDCKFCIGHFFGLILDGFKQTVEVKDDYERSLHYTEQDGGVVRMNRYVCKTRMGAKGGIGAVSARLQEYQKSIDILMEKYPARVRLNKRRVGEILIYSRH